MNSLDMVKEFHDAFGIKTEPKPISPELTSEQAIELAGVQTALCQMGRALHRLAKRFDAHPSFLRMQLIVEESAELMEALLNGDKKEALDALVDLRYVVEGTALTLGYKEILGDAFAEVHKSNMSKLNAQGKPVLDNAGRVQKGANYQAPDLQWLLDIAEQADV